MKRKMLAAVFLMLALFATAYGQERGQTLLANGVNITIINNGRALSCDDLNTQNGPPGYINIAVVIHWSNGSSKVEMLEIPNHAERKGSVTYQNLINIGRGIPTISYTRRPFVINLDGSAVAISAASAAQTKVAQASVFARSAKAFFNGGDYDRAIADYTQALQADPNNTNKDNASNYFWRGRSYLFKGDDDRAIADYTQAIRLDPNYVFAYGNRGFAYNRKKDYDRAIAEFTQAIRLDPNYKDAYDGRGEAYLGKKDYDRAIADCTQAIRLDPNFARAYNNRGAAYMQKGNFAQARADVNASLRINPNYQSAKDLDAELRRQGQ